MNSFKCFPSKGAINRLDYFCLGVQRGILPLKNGMQGKWNQNVNTVENLIARSIFAS